MLLFYNYIIVKMLLFYIKSSFFTNIHFCKKAAFLRCAKNASCGVASCELQLRVASCELQLRFASYKQTNGCAKNASCGVASCELRVAVASWELRFASYKQTK